MSRTIFNFILMLTLASCLFSCHNSNEPGSPADSCSNGVMDEGEQCIDCGGPCSPCRFTDGRYVQSIFGSFYKYSDIVYGHGAVQPSGNIRDLTCDFYDAEGDTLSARPLVIMMGQTTYAEDPDGTFFIERINYIKDLLSKGFTVSHINRIRYWDGEYPMSPDAFLFTAMRIRKDFIDAVNFFKTNAALFRIDTNNFFLMGSSMGAMAALHAAFLGKDDLDELDPYLAHYIESSGFPKGVDDDPWKPADVKGVISLSGMILNAGFIDSGEPSLLNIIGKNDAYRPFDCEWVKVNWISDSLGFCGPSAMENRMIAEAFNSGDRILKLIDLPPADHYAPHDPVQCPECTEVVSDFLANHLGYCLFRK